MKFPKGIMSADDCDRPACDDTVKALNAALARVNSKKEQDETTSQCPPNSAQLGRSTWDLLHSMVRIRIYAVNGLLLNGVSCLSIMHASKQSLLILCIVC